MAVAESKNASLSIRSKIVSDLEREFDCARSDESLLELQSTLSRLGVQRHIIRSFEEYEILDELGRGGFATTYQAREKATGSILAVKVYDSGTAECAEQMAEEITKLRNISHPALVQLLNAGASDDRLFAVMEYVNGVSVKSTFDKLASDFLLRIDKSGSHWKLLSNQQANLLKVWELPTLASQEYFKWILLVIEDIIDGVAILHSNGLLHGDLKPSNVLLFQNGNRLSAKVNDYCIDAVVAQHLRLLDTTAKTLTGSKGITVPLSKSYAAPELTKSFIVDNRLTKHADIYSMGVLAAELLLVPVSRPGGFVHNSLLQEELLKSSKVFRQMLGIRLSDVIDKATSDNPASRFTSMYEFWEALRESIFEDEESGLL